MATTRPSSTNPSEVTQTFTATYRRPFKGSDVNYDVDLEPATEFNLTSAFGCYKNTGLTTDGVFTATELGDNPDELSDAATKVGCFGHW